MDSRMKVAMPLYMNRVSPRFSYSREFLVVEIMAKHEVDREILTMDIESPVQIAESFVKEGIDLVLSGGMNPDFQKEFRLRNIGVIWGLIGEAEDVLSTYLKGKAFPGMGPCPSSRSRGRPPQKKK